MWQSFLRFLRKLVVFSIKKRKKSRCCGSTGIFIPFFVIRRSGFYFMASWTATATATVIPTIGLLPAPRKPIISTWAGTDEEPAN